MIYYYYHHYYYKMLIINNQFVEKNFDYIFSIHAVCNLAALIFLIINVSSSFLQSQLKLDDNTLF